MKKTKLTGLQKRTVDIYHSMGKPNKLHAMQLAGSTMKGRVGSLEAQRMFKKAHVVEYHESLKKKATERAERSGDEIIAELEKLAFSNIGDYVSFGAGGVILKASTKLTKDQLAAIVEVSETYTKRGRARRTFKLYDKKGALELLGKRFGLFPNRQEVTGPGGKPIPLRIVDFGKIDDSAK